MPYDEFLRTNVSMNLNKKILFLTAFLPHFGAAAEKNTLLMLEDLSKSFYVDLVYFKYTEQPNYVAPNDNINVKHVYTNSTIQKLLNVVLYPFVYPLFSVRFNKSILSELKHMVRDNHYDAIVCDHSQMFLYGLKLGTSIPKILYSHDVIAQRVGRSSNSVITALCKYSENKLVKQGNAHNFTVSVKDCVLLNELYNANAKLALLYLDPIVCKSTPIDIKTNVFIFMGKWSRADNLDGVVWFFKEVAPLIKEDVTISIIGKGFPKEKIANNNPHVKVNILGFVNNPYEMIANCTAVLSPLFTGAGIKVKVIESLACGVPVVGTEIAFEGIDRKYSDFMLLCNEPSDYIKAMEIAKVKSLEERKQMKNMFIAGYQSETIPNYLKKILA